MNRFLPLALALTLATSGTAQVMFPGDLNNDGTANHIDLLPLGVAYNRFGPPRDPASLEWIPQPNLPWADALPVSGVNLGFVDADGNGLIDSLDLEAIPFNYDSTQFLSIPEPRPYLLPDTLFVETPPELQLRFEPQTASPGDTVRLIVEYIVPDPNAFPPSGLPLGIAFSIGGLDTLPIVPPIRIFPDTVPGDLMFVAATETQARFWRSAGPGRIEFAAAGRGMGALNTSRKLAEMFIVMEDMIILREAPANIDSALLINTREQVIALKTRGDTLMVGSRQPAAPTAFARVFPNPARDELQVRLERPARFELALFNAAGQAVRKGRPGLAREGRLSIAGLPPGVYLLEIRTEQRKQVERVMVHRP
ncbi:MAG: T9SS type A sorting domain-containing protein [Phaeodactylibacter sp.]|nr:T9SS type A sorting domain-containing protein [Phaeodactylibacter sp.]MCB9297398.1 T9SS type A sorting domain-containing protein [Lewinellaceae bacterium]